eukprot:s881_g13.t1
MLLTLWRLTSQDEAVLLVPGFHFHSTLTSWLSHKKRCCVAKVAIAFFSPSILSMKRNEASLISHFISAHVRETVLQVIADPSGCDASSDKEFAQKSVYEVDDEDEPAGEQLEAVDDDPLRRPHPAAVEGEIPEEIEIEGEKHSAKSSLRKLREGLRVCGLQKHRSKDQAWKRIPNTMGILLRILVLHSPGGNSRGESCLKALHWDYHTMVNQASSEVNIKDARQTKAKMTFKQEMRTLASICAVMDDADAITASVTATKGDVAEATKAAANAAQSAAASAAGAATSSAAGATTAAGSPSNARTVDWSKLLNKPGVFGDGKSVEEDVKQWRDYQWQLQQYLVAIDEGYESELRQIITNPNAEMATDTASAETRNRSNKLYSLLASLMKNRCLAIVKSTQNCNGFEAFRQLISALRPPVQNRGLALLTAILHDVKAFVATGFSP